MTPEQGQQIVTAAWTLVVVQIAHMVLPLVTGWIVGARARRRIYTEAERQAARKR